MMVATFVLCGLISASPRLVPISHTRGLQGAGNQTYALDDPKADINHSFVSVKWEYEDAGQLDDKEASQYIKFVSSCINRCKGEKHHAHEECDFSCDERCKKGVHDEEAKPFRDQAADQEVAKTMVDSAKQFGLKVDMAGTVADFAKKVDKSIAENCTVKEKYQCWNKTPCSIAQKGYKSKRINVNITYQVYRKEPDGKGSQTTVNGPSKTIKLCSYVVPDTSAPIDNVIIQCSCVVVREKTKYDDIGGPFMNELGGEGGGLSDNGFPLFAGSEIRKFNVTASFDSMNSFQVSAINPLSMPVSFFLMPGTICTPDKSDQQTMCTTSLVRLNLMPKQRVSVHVPVVPVEFESAQGSGACINMHKKMPDGTAKYTILPSDDSDIAAMARFTSNERFHGPWTQTRFWIISDNATLDEVRKVLIPRPTEGIYLRSLYQVATNTSIDFTAKERKKLLEPRLIAGSTGTHDGTLWFVNIMAKIDAKGLADWVEKNPGAFAPLFEGKPDGVEIHHAADVATALLQSPDPNLRKAGIEFVRKAIPEAKRKDFVDAGGMDGLISALGDPKSCSAGLDAAELYPFSGLRVALCNVAPDASDAEKQRASKLIQALKD